MLECNTVPGGQPLKCCPSPAPCNIPRVVSEKLSKYVGSFGNDELNL